MRPSILCCVRVALACLLVAVVLSQAAPQVHAQDEDNRTVSMDFKNVDIHVLIKFISELTGKNFIIDRSVNGLVTVYSPTKVSVEDAYQVFLSILEVNHFTVVPAPNGMYKILSLQAGRSRSIRTLVGDEKPELGDELVTQVLYLKHSSATELSKLVTTLLGDRGSVTVYPPNNTLIVTAPYSLVERILTIAKEVDKLQYAPRFRTFFVKYGSARDLAADITKLMSTMATEREKAGQASLALLEADERVNKIIALADPENMDTIERIIEQLDIPTPKGKGDIHFVSLKNADAEDVAKVLNSLIETGSSTTTATDDPNATKILSKDVNVVADAPTNSLLVTAQSSDFETLERIIGELDVMRRQIFIEALIMEVSSDSGYSFGVNWGYGRYLDGSDASVFGGVNPGGSGSISLDDDAGIASFSSGGSIGAIIENAINVGGTAYSIQSILNLSQTNNDFRILSTPQLMTLDNQEAQVDIVDNVPFVTSVTTSAVNNDYNSQSIDYKDVGVMLKITPHIGTQNTLRLEVEQEVSRVVQTAVDTGSGAILAPTTKKRTVKTSIQMQDGQTAVIAGLISEDDERNRAQVPGLGDVPVLGWLFKYKEKSITRTNLFVFITPRVVDSYKESWDLARAKRSDLHKVEIGDVAELEPVLSGFMTPKAEMVR